MSACIINNNSVGCIEIAGISCAVYLDNLDRWINLKKSRKDVSNFDREFTSEAPKLTPTDKLFIMNLDQCEFSGFSYVNPEFVVTV